MGTVTLTAEQAATLIAFLDAFDLALTGAWPPVAEAMAADFGIERPAAALEAARTALSK